MKIWIVIGMWLAMSVSTTAYAQGDFADRFFAKVEKDALRDLERGKPAKQQEAAHTLGVEHAERVAPILAKHLSDPDPVIRLGAADLLWSLAASKPEAFASAQPALRLAIDDPDAAIAMNAAGALTAMGVPDAETAAARRRVLKQRGTSGYVQFLAARGLIGVDPGAPLAPILLGFLFDASSAETKGGSDDNREIAVQALNALVATQDRALIEPLRGELGTAHPATEYLLEAMQKFEPRPNDWTQVLIEHARSPNQEIGETAWDLLDDQRDPASISAWAPLAVKRLDNDKSRGSALSALYNIAGKTSIGLDPLAAVAADQSASEEHRVRAIDTLGAAAEVTRPDTNKTVAAAALVAWRRACDPVLSHESANKRSSACLGHLMYIAPQNKERVPQLVGWLGSNADVEAKLLFLERIESTWSDGAAATDAVKRELAHADPRVVKAAEAALDRIRPAWRESASRQARVAQNPATPVKPALESSSGRRGADGAALFGAVSAGNLAAVKKLVDTGNIDKPVHYPQIQGATPIPLGVAINYCGAPTLSGAKLASIVVYLISLGAEPDSNDPHGDNLFDRAKTMCPPEVMQALSR